MPPSFSSSKEILEQDSVELLEIELRRLTNAVEKLEESNRYLEKAIEEEEEEEEADLDIYRRAIKENAKAIPEHQSKIFEISQRIRELKPSSQRGEDRKDDDGSAWL
jgi:chromosome segregation ATPase